MEKVSYLPGVKVSEEKDEVVVRFNISGVDEKDIELDVGEDFLRVDVSKDFSESVNEKDYSSREWRSSSFGGAVSLPAKVAPELLHHSYDGKVLEVRLKKL